MTEQKNYVLRVEGVNLGNIIDDTDQLSVRRGGGLMLLNVATQLQSLLPMHVAERLTEIATGASIALFEFQADNVDDAEKVATEVRAVLRTQSLLFQKLLKGHRYEKEESHLPLKHGTFVVDVVAFDEVVGESQQQKEQQAEQLAVAKNRWRQLQQPTLSLDGLWDEGEKAPCHLDRTRIGVFRESLNDDAKDVPVSTTAFDRWKYGRGARQQFYQRQLGESAKVDAKLASVLSSAQFTDDLKTLSGKANGDAKEELIPPNLIDKLAIFYVDGNKFGQRGRDIYKKKGADGFRQWSTALKAHHRKLLAGLLKLAEDSRKLWKNGDEIRLETLLWGGDEILWVVPAWLGWEVARWFFSQDHSVKIGEQDEPLTYACGLVFCHAKAPIKNTSALAHKLGDLAKEARSEQHILAYEVLESYDDISGDLKTHRQRFLPTATPVGELVIDPTKLDVVWQTLIQIRQSTDFPMRQLYRLSSNWRKGAGFESPQARLFTACEKANIDVQSVLSALSPFGDPVGWLHLLQMLPYLTLTTEQSTSVQTGTTAGVRL